MERVRKHFEASGKASYIADEEARALPHLQAAVNSNSGRPAAGELGMLKWRPGEGAIWFTPGALMKGDVVNALQRECRAIANDNGLDYMASFVCGPRFARGVHAIIFNRDDARECEAADRCYRAMAEAFRARGIFVGRAPTSYQSFHQAQRTPDIVRATAALKAALDPNGIIAPGRYGIE
jgi:4-cresol dehydrogenase (hydroxylating)